MQELIDATTAIPYCTEAERAALMHFFLAVAKGNVHSLLAGMDYSEPGSPAWLAARSGDTRGSVSWAPPSR